jgi:hypothetical protein
MLRTINANEHCIWALFFLFGLKAKEYGFLFVSLFIALSILLKIVTLYIGLPLLYLVFQKYRFKFLSNFKIWLYAFLVLFPSVIWYYHAHMLFTGGGVTFNIWGFGTDKWGNLDLLLNPSFYSGLFLASIAESHLAYLGIVPFIIGLVLKRKDKYEKLFDYWMIAIIVYFLIVAQGNSTHDYYQLPFGLHSIFIRKTFSHYLPANTVSLGFS